jgi:hypothetical protein
MKKSLAIASFLFYSPPAMFKSFDNNAGSAPREICEDAPCCGCCGHEAVWDEEDRYDFSGEDWNRGEYCGVEEEEEEEEEEYEEGGEDSYLDASWEDRFEIDMGDY